MEVSHSLKSLCIFSLRSSTYFSSSGIQDSAKWQFYNSTQPPLPENSFIISLALGPYPYPREIVEYLFPICDSSANLRKSATGSEPALSTNISGVIIELSLKQFLSSKIGDIMNFYPRISEIQFWMAGTTLSGLRHLSTIIFSNLSSLSFHGAGNAYKCASCASNIFLNSSGFSMKFSKMPLNSVIYPMP